MHVNSKSVSGVAAAYESLGQVLLYLGSLHSEHSLFFGRKWLDWLGWFWV